jgi:DNA-binding transcriptional LysR family regulator
MRTQQPALDWGDLEICLAIADRGSVLAAAEALGVSHSTVLRRLGRVEARLETRLFDRYTKGAKPTDAGRELISVARDIGGRVDDLFVRVSGANTQMRGRIRLATADQIGAILMPEVRSFCLEHPAIEIDITIAQNVKSASQSKAHLIVMLSDAPPEGHTGYRIGAVGFAPYVSREAAEDQPIESFPWIGHAPSLKFTFQGQIDRLLGPRMSRRHTTDSISGHLNALRSGLGIGLVACGVGDADPILQRCGPVLRPRNAELWVLHRADVGQHGATRALARRLRDSLAAQAGRLAGDRPLHPRLDHPQFAQGDEVVVDEKFVSE